MLSTKIKIMLYLYPKSVNFKGASMKKRVKELIKQATTKGIIDQERFAELITAECVAAVLDAEVSLSSFISALIEERIGFKQGHFDTQWYIDNYNMKKIKEK